MHFTQLSRLSLTYVARLLATRVPFVSFFAFASAFVRARAACRDAWCELDAKERDDLCFLWGELRAERPLQVREAVDSGRLVVLRYLHSERPLPRDGAADGGRGACKKRIRAWAGQSARVTRGGPRCAR